MDIYKALGLQVILSIPGGVDKHERPPSFTIRREAEELRLDRTSCAFKIGSRSLKCGRLAEFYRATYEDVIAANQQQPAYQKAYLLSRTLLVDGRRQSTQDILDMDNNDVEQILKLVYAAMRT
jgi:hypothetical protein